MVNLTKKQGFERKMARCSRMSRFCIELCDVPNLILGV